MIRMFENQLRHSFLVVIVLAAAISGVACGAEGTSGIDDDSDVALMMKMTPSDLRSFVFADVQVMRDHPDLAGYLIESEGPSGYLDSYDVSLGDVDQLVISSYIQGMWLIPPLQIVQGDFDSVSIRDLLGSERYTEHEFAGVEIWDVEIEDYADAVAFFDDTIFIGYRGVVRNAIEVTRSDRTSLYDDDDFSDVVRRLPKGISIAMREGEFLGGYAYEGLLVSGLSAVKKNEDIIKLTWVIKFEDDDAASNALSSVRNDVATQELPRLENIEVTRKDEFIKVTARTSIVDYFGTDIQEE